MCRGVGAHADLRSVVALDRFHHPPVLLVLGHLQHIVEHLLPDLRPITKEWVNRPTKNTSGTCHLPLLISFSLLQKWRGKKIKSVA